MKYKVSGVNRDTGARMTLEFEASNKAMAERRATQSGMGEVRHCEPMPDPNSLQVESRSRRGEHESPKRGGKIIGLIVVIIVMACVGWMMFRQ